MQINLKRIKNNLWQKKQTTFTQWAEESKQLLESGYLKKLMAARLAAGCLSAKYNRSNPEKSKPYIVFSANCAKEFKKLYEKAKW